MDAKRFINTTLDYLKYQVNNDLCTMDELESISKVLQDSLNTVGTVEDFAKFFNQSEGNVRKVINRKVIDKPKRRVYYHFLPFVKNVPSKWLDNK